MTTAAKSLVLSSMLAHQTSSMIQLDLTHYHIVVSSLKMYCGSENWSVISSDRGEIAKSSPVEAEEAKC